MESPKGRAFAHIRWLPESDWLVVRLETRQPERAGAGGDGAMQQRVEELLQERETTYRNLLAAYLRLQEVNRQKTVFLASAAHELKTPLAVIKGYYDLLLSGSLGKLTDKQRDILQESKESCERLVRLVSMFLELFGAGKRQARDAPARKRHARLSCGAGDALARSLRAEERAAGSFDFGGHTDLHLRLPEDAADGRESSG